MVEKVKYDIIDKINDIEIRKYPELILAVVEEYNENNEFGLLFNYISGNNKAQKKIEMTAPVITSEKIKMTAPVITQKNYMAFIMPSIYNKDTIPIPLNPKVKIKIEHERILAVIRFSGYANTNRVDKNQKKLFEALRFNNIKIKGDPILMRYNSPFAPGFIRRNEIGVEIIYK
jgi:hypothetical protein